MGPGQETTVGRVFDSPRDIVYKAWTEPERFARWYGPVGFGTPLETVSLDVRPGGKWRATIVSEAHGTEIPFGGTYREVVRPERLVFTFEDVEDREGANAELATVTFADLGQDTTEVVYHQQGHLPPEEYELINQGISSYFDSLEEYLERSRAAAGRV